MPYIPHTEAETKEMLIEMGVDSIEDLYAEIPSTLRYQNELAIPKGLTELEVKQLINQKLKDDQIGACFIGAGAYEHHIPAAVTAIVSRGEFLTAYTAYQAEASQGNLQLIYEYQSMLASLMGLDVSNASVYDGATALAESILMAVRTNKNNAAVVLVPRTVHPAYRRVVDSVVSEQNIKVVEIDYDVATGQTLLSALKKFEHTAIAALVIPTPNFFGVIEQVDRLTDWAHQQGALAIACVNPVAMSLIKEPGQWGVKGVRISPVVKVNHCVSH